MPDKKHRIASKLYKGKSEESAKKEKVETPAQEKKELEPKK